MSCVESLAGLGLAAANLTAYLDLTLGVKSTFLRDPFAELALAVLGRFGVVDISLVKTGVSILRGERRIDFRPENIGNLEAKLDLVVGAGSDAAALIGFLMFMDGDG